ncbi:MAG: hypothetical protein JSR78_08485 [Proteobacteria bacterium]|nr:hypothetical protein [Pseudomonadota bacterium]
MSVKKDSALPSRFLPPPPPEDNVKRALNHYGDVRREDGKISRKTGRDVQFATIVTPEFKKWMKEEAKRRGKKQCVLLEDMRAAYLKVQAEKVR